MVISIIISTANVVAGPIFSNERGTPMWHVGYDRNPMREVGVFTCQGLGSFVTLAHACVLVSASCVAIKDCPVSGSWRDRLLERSFACCKRRPAAELTSRLQCWLYPLAKYSKSGHEYGSNTAWPSDEFRQVHKPLSRACPNCFLSFRGACDAKIQPL
jgi:hypothetical protein